MAGATELNDEGGGVAGAAPSVTWFKKFKSHNGDNEMIEKHRNCNDGHPWFVEIYGKDIDNIVKALLDIADSMANFRNGNLVDAERAHFAESREYYKQHGAVAWLDIFVTSEDMEDLHKTIELEIHFAKIFRRPIDWIRACFSAE